MQQESLAELLTREQGKPLSQSREEIVRAASLSEGMAAIPIEPEVLVENAQRHVELHYFPLGVVGIITPWNAPINLAAGPLTMALYTGNTAVLKPSPHTPLCTLKLGELLRDIFPAGVVNILAGGDDCGQWMSEHPGIDKISFTGSVASGKKVMASAAATRKRIYAHERALGLLEDSRHRGGHILAGGEVAPGPGYFIAPTIITDLPEDARLIKEEQFGPLLPVLQFSDVGDAIRRANDTRYGLAASVCRSVASRNPASDAITPSSD